jgi:hypothetical protein
MDDLAISPPSVPIINWENIPINDCSWIEKSDNRKFLSNLFLACTLPSAAATYYVSFKWFARPIFNRITFWGSAAATLALLVAGVVLRSLQDCIRDPKLILSKRQKLAKMCNGEIPIYRLLVEYEQNFVLDKNEVQILLEQDIRNFSYQDFILKHRSPLINLPVLKDLSEENIFLLRPKYLEWLLYDQKNKNITNIAADPTNQLFKISEYEISYYNKIISQRTGLESLEKEHQEAQKVLNKQKKQEITQAWERLGIDSLINQLNQFLLEKQTYETAKIANRLQIIKLEDDIKQSNEQLEKAKQENPDLQDAIDKHNLQLSSLIIQLNDKEEKSKKLEEKHLEVNHDYRDLEKKYDEIKRQFEDNKKEIEQKYFYNDLDLRKNQKEAKSHLIEEFEQVKAGLICENSLSKEQFENFLSDLKYLGEPFLPKDYQFDGYSSR